MRKHLKNKRLESLRQLGTDRIMDLQFGSGEAAYHIILELYDRGNIILTDYEYIILNVLRPHTEGDKIKFAVREKYPQDRARESKVISKEDMIHVLENAKSGEQLKKILVSNLGKICSIYTIYTNMIISLLFVEYGPAIIEHVLLKQGFSNSTKIRKTFNIREDIDKLMDATSEAEHIFQLAKQNHEKVFKNIS